MTINTTFSIGDTVWFINEGRAHSAAIYKIEIESNITYWLKDEQGKYHCNSTENLFGTKAALIEYVSCDFCEKP